MNDAMCWDCGTKAATEVCHSRMCRSCCEKAHGYGPDGCGWIVSIDAEELAGIRAEVARLTIDRDSWKKSAEKLAAELIAITQRCERLSDVIRQDRGL